MYEPIFYHNFVRFNSSFDLDVVGPDEPAGGIVGDDYAGTELAAD